MSKQWGETRRLVLDGRVVISQTPSDPGDIGEPRITEMDGTTYVSVPEFELWPTDRDWQPHDASVVFVSRRSLVMQPPGKIVYHLPRNGYMQTRCGLSFNGDGRGWPEPLVNLRRDVASRIAYPCGVCGADE